jgi:hypothetical protein
MAERRTEMSSATMNTDDISHDETAIDVALESETVSCRVTCRRPCRDGISGCVAATRRAVKFSEFVHRPEQSARHPRKDGGPTLVPRASLSRADRLVG